MNRYVLGIDGMRCPMCEGHVESVLKDNCPKAKVKANHKKNTVILISENEYDENKFKAILDPTGYRLLSFKKEEAVNTLFSWR